MRIRIVHIPRSACIDDIPLDQFVVGREYDVGNRIGAVLLCERWAVPVDDARPLTMPPRKFDAADTPARHNLIRNTRPSLDAASATDLDRRRSPRRRFK